MWRGTGKRPLWKQVREESLILLGETKEYLLRCQDCQGVPEWPFRPSSVLIIGFLKYYQNPVLQKLSPLRKSNSDLTQNQ